MLSLKTILLGASLAAIASCLPSADTTTGLLAVRQVDIADGTVIYWARDGSAAQADEEARALQLDRREQCGDNAVTCHGSHKATTESCLSLLKHLEVGGDMEKNKIDPEESRSVCAYTSSGKCCTSWTLPVFGAEMGYLHDAVLSIFNTCYSESGISGLSDHTIIGAGCLTQCLSDRETGCY